MSIGYTINGNVAIVTLDRVDKKNALTVEMRVQIRDVFERLQDADHVRAIVLTGAGNNFSAGADVNLMGGTDIPASLGRMRLLNRMVGAIGSNNKPVISAVCGVCIGVAWSIVLAGDFVLAAEDARFQFAFRHVGLAGDGGAAYLLTRHVSVQRAKEIMYSGRFVSGTEARDLGLALEALPSENVLPRALELAYSLAAAPTLALAMMKRQFDCAPLQNLDLALAFESNTQALMIQSEDFAEGTTSFKERRKPVFTGA